MRPDVKAGLCSWWFCIVLQTLFVLTASLTIKDVCRTTCSLENGDDGTFTNDACSISYIDDRDVCRAHIPKDEDLTSHDPQTLMNSRNFWFSASPVEDPYSIVDLALALNTTGEVVLVLNGVTTWGSKKCIIICFGKHHAFERTSVLKASCVKVPNGRYNVTVMTQRSPEVEGVTCKSLKTESQSFGSIGLQVISHSSVDILNVNDTGLAPHRCPCNHCLDTYHHYDNDTALLKFFYRLNSNATEDCCSNCTELNLVLYQYMSVANERQCAYLDFNADVFGHLQLVVPDRNVTKGPIEYPNIDNGCYAFRLRPMVDPYPKYHGFFWLKPSGNVTNMNDWNTTFYLHPRPERRSLEVKWMAPSYPFNFSSYDLQLWHHWNTSISCLGQKVVYGRILLIPKNGKISLNTTSYHFHNLSPGWYCARVTPIDHRCPPDGCEPRSSPARMLKGVPEEEPEKESDDDMALVIIGAAAGVLVAGAVLAFVVMRCRASHSFFKVNYVKVNGGGRISDVREVLIVWTTFGADGAHLAPVIQAFKNVLSSYGRCKVMDYLDLRSIPSHQQEHLLASPTAWLDTLLCQQRIKILLVGTEGGRARQLQRMTSTGDTRYEETLDLQPLDVQLFPYLLCRLQDRPDLAADYSRVFHVRFSDISPEGAELEGVVSWTRYNLPQHLRALVLALHSVKEETCDFKEPTSDILQPFQRAIINHPLYGQQSTANKDSSVNHLDNHLKSDSPFLDHPLLNHSSNDPHYLSDSFKDDGILPSKLNNPLPKENGCQKDKDGRTTPKTTLLIKDSVAYNIHSEPDETIVKDTINGIIYTSGNASDSSICRSNFHNFEKNGIVK